MYTTVRFLVLAVALLLLALAATADELRGKVVSVTDGDTITVLIDQEQVKVRLAEIDAPERGQPWGQKAKDALAQKVFGAEVWVSVLTTDRYGRTVGKVWLGNRDINRELVAEGHAWVYRRYMEDESLLDDEQALGIREAACGA